MTSSGAQTLLLTFGCLHVYQTVKCRHYKTRAGGLERDDLGLNQSPNSQKKKWRLKPRQSFFHVELKLQTRLIILKKSECFLSELFIIRDAAFSAAAVTQTSDMQSDRLHHQIWSLLTLSNQIPTFCSSKWVQWKDWR